jgi:AcrR family transcriptional regulator
MPAVNTPRRRLAPEARRAQILDAAARAFVAEGYTGTSMAAISAAAGVTPRIVYKHFSSKAVLYRAVLQRTARRLTEVFARPVGRYGVATAVLLAAGRADSDGFRVLWRHAVHEREFHDVVAEVRAHAVDCARAGLQSWTPEGGLDWAARAVVSCQLESVLNWLEYGQIEHDDRFVRATNAALSAGVRAWSAD